MPDASAPPQHADPSAPAIAGPAAPEARAWPWIVAVMAITLVVFLPALRNGFVRSWDDGHYVLDNTVIRQLDLETVRKAVTAEKVHYWAPLTWLSLAVDYGIWGLDPLGYHLGNVLLHALNAGLVFLLARRLLALPAVGIGGRRGCWAAAFAALVWSLHPLRVEAVAWVVERKSVLTLAFALGAILAYVGHAESRLPFWRSRRYALSLGLLACSLAAKPALVTLPVVLSVMDGWPLRREGRGVGRLELAEKVPMLILSAACSVIYTSTSGNALAFPLEQVGLLPRVILGLRSMWAQSLLTLWPAGLSPFYIHPPDLNPVDPVHLVPALLVIALTAAALLRARRRPALAAGWLAWLVALVPGITAAQVSPTWMADRFTYFAAIPIAVLAGGLLATILARLGSARSPWIGSAAGAILVLLAGLSVRQTAVWEDDVTLWSRPIELAPSASGRVYTERSIALEERGELQRARADMDAAIAIAAGKGYASMDYLFARRARLLAALGRGEDALADFDRALQVEGSPARGQYLEERAELARSLRETAGVTAPPGARGSGRP